MTVNWLGIVGGCGPVASTHIQHTLQQRATVSVEQEHVPILNCVDSTMPSRVKAINGEIPVPVETVEDFFVTNATFLDYRCDYLVIGSNTSHYFYDAVNRATDADVIHLPHTALDALVDNDENQIQILGTNTLAEVGVYDTDHDIDVTHVDPDGATDVIFEIKNDNMDEARWLFEEWLQQEANPDIPVLLACTELSKLDIPLPFYGYDAVDLFADFYLNTCHNFNQE